MEAFKARTPISRFVRWLAYFQYEDRQAKAHQAQEQATANARTNRLKK